METHNIIDHVKQSFDRHKKPILITTGSAIAVVLFIVSGTYGFAKYYENKIYPNVTVGAIELGGLTRAEAYDRLQNAYENMLNEGLMIEFNHDGKKEEVTLALQANLLASADLAYDRMDFNVDAVTDEAFQIGRTQSGLNRFIEPLALLINTEYIAPKFVFFEDQIRDEIQDTFGKYEEVGAQTSLDIQFVRNEPVITVQEGTNEQRLGIDELITRFKEDALDFKLQKATLKLIEQEPQVTPEEAETLIEKVTEVLAAAPFKLTYTSDRTNQTFSWNMTDRQISGWLVPAKENGIVDLRLDTEKMETFWESVRENVDIRAENARFRMEDNRVVEFKGSQDGVSLDEEATVNQILLAFSSEKADIPAQITIVQPEIPTESVNDLGIKDILGVGFSDFSGSAGNRIANIKHGASKLNGLLIAPGQTVSLVEELKPFTVADGYLPELVIKGDEIIPEIGGGLCQIGTTTFRAVMNSGLKVTERRNHSLVVSYYNDPSNGNPGTDATLYDPAPDFKFENDTENYILLETNVDLNKMHLYFTFWGTDDGRKAHYTPPQVLSRTGPGPTQYTETTSLAPGVTKCQSAYTGMRTSFDYIVEYANGEKHEQTFTSTYRSLPQICLVGKADDSDDDAE